MTSGGITVANGTCGAVAGAGTTYTFTVTATGGTVSIEVATNSAIDVAGNGNTGSNTLSIVYDRLPTMTSIGNKSVAEAATLSFSVVATDADVDAITYAAIDYQAGATLDPNTGAFSWTPGITANASSPYTVTFTATANGETTTEAITITVTNADQSTSNDIYWQ